MITTYINKEYNQYIVEYNEDNDKLPLTAFLWVYKKCDVKLNLLNHNRNYDLITQKEYYEIVINKMLMMLKQLTHQQ